MSKNIEPLEIVAIYRIWTSILYRCNQPKNKQYKNYGGRGIKICDDWLNFNKFCEDVGPRPFNGCHLDRINNDKGYFKENCRWTTPKINHRNKRNNDYYNTHLGKICQSELIEKMGYTRSQFRRAKEKYGIEKLLSLFKKNELPSKKEAPDLNDIIGKNFDSVTVQKVDPDFSTGRRYFCLCFCGNPIRISRFNLLNRPTNRCRSCSRKNKA